MADDRSVTQPLLSEEEKDVETLAPPVTHEQRTPKSKRARIVKVVHRVVLFALLWTVIHRWLFGLALKGIRTNQQEGEVRKAHGCSRAKNAWMLDAFVRPPRPHVPFGRKAEELYLSVPNAASAINASRQYAGKPHLAGSDGDLQTAMDFLALLQRELNITKPASAPIFPAGSEASRNATLSISNLTEPTAWIDVYYPVMNTPVSHSLEILDGDSVAWKADLEEVVDHPDKDGDAWAYSDAVPAWHGLSRGGTAEGKLIYANYGSKSDYDELVEKGVNFTGAIVLARYGGIFRGLKVKGAQELGAAGILIYSDPRDDGSVTTANGYKAYPEGPARNPTSVQRGSVQFLSIYPGDPTTPGYPAYENSTRTNGSNIPDIPSLPISWTNAQVLLKEIQGGKEGRTVRLVNNVDDKVIPIWNPMGVIPGYIKDEVVIIGNHRDAWVLGAADPTSGTASVHEVIRGFGALLRQGWKPLRTIVFASWDAEEYGLIGSTEWGEDFKDWIKDNVVAYLNLDSSVGGSRFGASASPSLSHFVRSTAEQIPHPYDPTRTLWDATEDSGSYFGEDAEDEVQAEATDNLGVRPLGSGSDYTVFLQHIGVASADAGGFGATRSDAVYHYHSVYDSEPWMETYGDIGFLKHVAVSKNLGLQALRIANAIVLPFNTTHYAFQLDAYLDEVEALASQSAVAPNLAPLRASIKALQFASLKLDHEKFYAEEYLKRLIRRWRRWHHCKKTIKKFGMKVKNVLGLKKAEEEVHSKEILMPEYVAANGQRIRPRVGRYPAWLKEQEEKAKEEAAWPPHLPHPHLPHPHWPRPPKGPGRKILRAVKHIREINKKLSTFESGFIHEGGIKDREWYKHLGVAPGKWLGYGATTLPALTEAITIEKNTTLAEYEAERLKGAIEKITAALKA
ncbi:Zn-dependent exopeptidase [Dentipellis sp. KUC8613]|nr:Zn-dependent exopeptidase [Dentipellis sp. KUC8613]